MHAITDVTGFGLLGHALEMARGSGITLAIRDTDVPILAAAGTLAEQGFVTGASRRNWASYGAGVVLPAGLPEWRRMLLADPQTSGGLLIACAPDRAPGLVAELRAGGYPNAAAIGTAETGEPRIRVI